MSIFGTIKNFILSGAKDVVHVAERIWTSVQLLWHLLGSVTGAVGNAWGVLYNAIRDGADALGEAAEAAYTTGRWLLTALPRAVGYVFSEVIGWAGREIHTASHAVEVVARDVIKAVERFVLGLINDVKHAVAVVEGWAKDALNFVEKYGALVVNLLGHPERLVTWILPVLIEPLLKWLAGESKGVLLWLLRNLKGLSAEFVHVLEEVLKDFV